MEGESQVVFAGSEKWWEDLQGCESFRLLLPGLFGCVGRTVLKRNARHERQFDLFLDHFHYFRYPSVALKLAHVCGYYEYVSTDILYIL